MAPFIPADYAWTIIFALCGLVFTMRCSFLVLPRRYQPKGALAHALSFAPLAALMAICVPEVMKLQIENWPMPFDTFLKDWRLWGGLTMVIVVAMTRSSRSATLYGLLAASIVIWML
jgi:branched-subunit amino acid transport protein